MIMSQMYDVTLYDVTSSFYDEEVKVKFLENRYGFGIGFATPALV